MEQLHIQEQQDPKNLEELNALLSKGDTETLEGLQNLGDTTATQQIISHVAGNNPTFAGNLQSLQYNVGGSLTGKMKGQQCIASSEKLQASNNITDYFSLDTESTFKLQEELSELGLDIFQFLTSLKQHIETHFSGLKECHKEKIRLSIGRKTANISKIVSEIKSESTSPKDFKGKRWILNDKISEAYNFYTQELFPTLQMKLALNNREKVPEKYTTRQPIIVPSMYGGVIEGNENFIEIDGYMNEIDQLLNAKVDKNGDFDEGFFSTQSLLSRNNDIHSAMLEEMGIQEMENVSLLNDRDEEIQAEAMVYYLFAVGIQCVPYIGGVPGVAADATDIFSSEDATIMGLQEAGLIEKEFQMEKTTFDRILAGAGIVLTVVGLQALARSKKLAKALKKISNIPASEVSEMLSNFGKKFNISADTLSGIRKLFGLEETKAGGKITKGVEKTKVIDFSPDDLQRLERASSPEVLGIVLNDKQKKAIIDAHNIGKRGENGSYSIGDLRKKVKILQEAGFTSGETRKLFDKNICGTEYPKFANLYEDPRFSFLSEYKNILGEISEADIVGEGINGITLKSPSREGKLLKIAKPGETDDLMQELHNHQKFRQQLEKLRDIYTQGPKKELLDNFDIPQISAFGQKNGIYEMEYIPGKNMRTTTILEYYSDKLFDISPQELAGLTDHGVEELLRKRGLPLYPTGHTEANERWMITKDREFIVDVESVFDRGRGKSIEIILKLFEKEGYKHGDGHWGNFILGNNGKIYMIDFGRSIITPKK